MPTSSVLKKTCLCLPSRGFSQLGAVITVLGSNHRARASDITGVAEARDPRGRVSRGHVSLSAHTHMPTPAPASYNQVSASTLFPGYWDFYIHPRKFFQ